jgi:hypothetical protein
MALAALDLWEAESSSFHEDSTMFLHARLGVGRRSLPICVLAMILWWP